jgi:hypothetical protein
VGEAEPLHCMVATAAAIMVTIAPSGVLRRLRFIIRKVSSRTLIQVGLVEASVLQVVRRVVCAMRDTRAGVR